MADNLLSSFLSDDRAATGFFPQMKPRRRLQDVQGSANVPLDVTRGRVAGLAGLLPDVLNFMGRSPMPTEMFGETQYEPAQQLPYGSEYFLQNLPLKPTSRIGEVAGQAGAFVPLNPMPAARAVAAGARALGPTAVRMGEGYLQRQGLMPELDVYHGSPYKFDRFDASKIGTGEGNQAYGHGLYTAEAPAVAKGYQLAEATYKTLHGGLTNKQEFVADMLSQGRPEMSILDLYAQKYGGSFDDAMKDLIDVKEIYKKSGNFYKVDLPDEQIAKMLDWDKPLSEQSVEIRSSLAPIIEATAKSFPEIRKADPTGAQLYRSYVNHRGNNADYASEGFRQAGIPGIKYLDEGSRGAGTGTRNFVTFPGEEQSLTILERNNQPVQQAMNEFEQSLINFMATPAK